MARRPDPACVTTPLLVVSSATGTFHSAAAAASSSCRPAAPAARMGSQLVGVAVLPPATCAWYRDGSKSACSTRTLAQSTSSSSAMSMGSMVLIPWPISGFLAVMVTRLSAVMRM